jgi:hypothetical protein
MYISHNSQLHRFTSHSAASAASRSLRAGACRSCCHSFRSSRSCNVQQQFKVQAFLRSISCSNT